MAYSSTPHVSGFRSVKLARPRWSRERGQAMAEYGVVLAVIAITWLLALAVFWWRR